MRYFDNERKIIFLLAGIVFIISVVLSTPVGIDMYRESVENERQVITMKAKVTTNLLKYKYMSYTYNGKDYESYYRGEEYAEGDIVEGFILTGSPGEFYTERPDFSDGKYMLITSSMINILLLAAATVCLLGFSGLLGKWYERSKAKKRAAQDSFNR